MQKIIEKAAVLIEALPYIQTFRNQIIVVKFGGSAMENQEHARSVLTDLAFMECVGMKPVLVHGGGKAISRALNAQGIQARFEQGLRVTCKDTIAVVEQVLNREVNPWIVGELEQRGAHAVGVHGEDVFEAYRCTREDPTTGATGDWGFVGEPATVHPATVLNLVHENIIPVVTPLGRGADGKLYNMNADVAAAALARELKAAKLAYLSDVPGLLRNPDDAESLIATLRESEVEELIRQGIIGGGMLPKINSAIEALMAGVKKIHLIDGRMQHSLLLEIFTDKGVGTEITANE